MTIEGLSDDPAHGRAASAEARAAAPARERGTIVLARHGEPALSRRCRLCAREYLDWWARYEDGGLLPGQSPPDGIVTVASGADKIFTSTRLRSIETATAVAAGKPLHTDEVFIEAPLPPPDWPDWIRLKPRTWGVVSRFWWWFLGNHRGQETKRQAQRRAILAARKLTEEADRGADVLLVAHGFFNTMIGLELQRMGWKLVRDGGFKYWSTRHFERG